jgi:ABC-2 type transport system ATP-binding protein
MVSVGPAPDRPLLAAEGVARKYGRTVALAPTTLEIHAGDSLALIGPNGAGKSTLLSILAGALQASDGRISVGAADHRPAPKIGWLPQRPAHYGRLTARENLELFARLEGLVDPEGAAERLLQLVELSADDRPALALSSGNQQRLNLAVSLLAQPDVLLLDEPTASLDPRQRRRFWEVASNVHRSGGAIVFATQNLEELERFASRVAVLLEGKLVFDGTVAEFSRSPEADVFS